MAAPSLEALEARVNPSVPQAPYGLAGNVLSSRSVELRWVDPNGFSQADGQVVLRADRFGSYGVLAYLSPGVERYVDNSAAPGSEYFYALYAYNGDGNSNLSNEVRVTTGDGVPAAPGILQGRGVGPRRVDLSWSGDGRENGFLVERSDGSGFFTTIANVGRGTRDYSDTAVVPLSTYAYRIRAYNDFGYSELSSTVTVTTPGAAPSAPYAAQASLLAASQVVLRWQSTDSGVIRLVVERNDGAGFFQRAVLGAGIFQYVDSGLASATAYQYRIYAENAYGRSEYSNVAFVTTPEVAPSAPVSLAASFVTRASVTLVWALGSSNAVTVVVQRAVGSGGFTTVATLSGQAISYVDRSVGEGSTYQYLVYALNSVGRSPESNRISVTTGTLEADRSYVRRLYEDVLGRTASAQEISGWTDALLSADKTSIARGFVGSDEHHGIFVTTAYANLLGRVPGGDEVAGWVSAMGAGMSEESVTASLLASPEYFARNGGTAVSFVRALYRDVLKRTGSEGDIAFWAPNVATMGTVGIANGFVASPEYRVAAVGGYYRRYLARAASLAEASAWAAVLPPSAVKPIVLGSAEYVAVTPAPNGLVRNRTDVGRFYSDALGRDATASELDRSAKSLTVQDVSDLAFQLLGTDEVRSRQIAAAYVDLLGRAASEDEIRSWLAFTRAAAGADRLAEMIAGSEEYFRRNGATAEGFVRALYRDFLGREASATEVGGWTPAVATAGRAAVAQGIAGSSEAHAVTVDAAYRAILAREPDRSGLDVWVEALNRGLESDRMRALLFASGEYLGH